ncbi:hypothetical protein CesoFtcFv8_000302 [Champsocephalus esox]|uniref:Uncharacterized protein n=1 Tax=Champsocephalus esox TaxID=159716 RepID=A0AAN8DVE3_9TELE|nr:hypothetical protein CesoFtcFv8_000302 [Champsocephalus esox]
MEEDQVPNKDSPQATDVKKVQRKSETKRYSEIFRDFDNLELSLISCSEEDLVDIDSQSISESISTEGADPTEQHDVSVCAEANELDENQPGCGPGSLSMWRWSRDGNAVHQNVVPLRKRPPGLDGEKNQLG